MSWKNDQVSELETQEILKIARRQLNVEGDFVEFGCYTGDTSMLLAEILKETTKKLYLYDSFEGLPEKTPEDQSEIGKDFQKGALLTSKAELKKRFLRTNLPVPIIKKAWFNELKAADLPEKIAFAFLDGDFYDSIKTSLKLIENNLTDNARILVHDYQNPALPGVSKAVNEWLLKNPNSKKQIIGSSLILF